MSKTDTSERIPTSYVPEARIAVERHRRGNRWMHWMNFPLLTVMIWSGLRIYWADLRDPFVFGIFGWEIYEFFPDWVNEPLSLNRKLARGMAFHFTFAWLFVINGAAFSLYIWRTGGWRNFLPTRDDLKTIPAVLLHECGIRKEAPPQGKYNGMQQLTYGAVLVMGALAIISGFAIYKPTQLAFLTTLMGGYSGARFIHFAVTIGFLLFFVIHILQVARAGLSNLFSMVTGYELLPSAEPMQRFGTSEMRLNARIRDIVSVIVLPTVAVLFLAAVDTDESAWWVSAIITTSVLLAIAWDFVWVAVRGSTPGKQIGGLRVVAAGTNNKPAIWQAFVRSLRWAPLLLLLTNVKLGLAVAVVIGILAVGFITKGTNRRSIMDLLSGTEVIAVESIKNDSLSAEQAASDESELPVEATR